ncbi:MAG: glycosyltransferase family 4 protein [Aquisalimonadaceae bacterium]
MRTIANLVEHLGDELNFCIVTRDRDALDDAPYADVEVDAWNRVGKARVFYGSPNALTLRGIARLLRRTPHDVLYLNSFFDPRFTGLPLLVQRLGLVQRRPCVLAPRGEFSSGALMLKSGKKRAYLWLARSLGVYSNLTWQASSRYEAEDTERALGENASRIVVAPNLPPATVAAPSEEPRTVNEDGPSRVVFLSRITAMKNLDFALRVLARVTVKVIFDIYGPIRDEPYWHQCEALIEEMPEHVSVQYRGSIDPSEVPGVMASYDLFFLPTLGENYGHVIPEALVVGTPVLISNATPWRDLKKEGVGWDLPLQAGEAAFAACIEELARMDPKALCVWRRHTAAYAASRLSDPESVNANRQLFLTAAGR